MSDFPCSAIQFNSNSSQTSNQTRINVFNSTITHLSGFPNSFQPNKANRPRNERNGCIFGGKVSLVCGVVVYIEAVAVIQIESDGLPLDWGTNAEIIFAVTCQHNTVWKRYPT